MIRTLTLNPAADRSLIVEGFAIDKVNRLVSSRTDAGGKGINVSKVIKALGGESVAYGFLGGRTGQFIKDYLADHKILADFVEINGETRTNLKIVDPVRKTHTDLNEPGPSLSPADLLNFETKFFGVAALKDVAVFSGSLPKGIDLNVYAGWIDRARKTGLRCVLDADGEVFRRGLEAGPYLVKPNIHELETYEGRPLSNVNDITKAALALLNEHTRIVVVSLGSEGALFMGNLAKNGGEPQAFLAEGIKVETKSTVGAGDSMIATLALGIETDQNLEALIAPAIATASAAVSREGSANVSPEAVAPFLAKVRYRALTL